MDEADLYETVYLKGRCPRCGEAVDELDKDTSTGRDLRFFKCSACSWSDFVDVGVALWKALSDAADKEQR
jgi:hypothetical protein